MAFNFMSFLGGAAGAGSEYIDTKNEAAAAEKLTKEERQWQIATEARRDAAARKLIRDNKRDSTNEYIATLTSLGYDTDSASSIAAGGAVNVAKWTDIGVKYKQAGHAWDINLLVGNKKTTDVSVINEATNDVVDPSTITSTQAAWMSMGEEPDPIFQDLNNAHGFYQNKANNATGAKKNEYQKKADASLASILAKEKKKRDEEGEKNNSLFSKPSMVAIRKVHDTAGKEAVNMELDRITKTITRSGGDLGRFSIGTLNGINITREFNKVDGEVADQNLENSLVALEKLAKQNLRLHANKAIGGEADFVTQYIPSENLMEGYAPSGFQITTKQVDAFAKGFLPEAILDIANARGAFTFGSVIKMVDKNGVMRVLVYTGIEGSEFFTTEKVSPEEM